MQKYFLSFFKSETPSPAAFTLHDFPNEILLLIFNNLPVDTLIMLLQVSKKFNLLSLTLLEKFKLFEVFAKNIKRQHIDFPKVLDVFKHSNLVLDTIWEQGENWINDGKNAHDKSKRICLLLLRIYALLIELQQNPIFKFERRKAVLDEDLFYYKSITKPLTAVDFKEIVAEFNDEDTKLNDFFKDQIAHIRFSLGIGYNDKPRLERITPHPLIDRIITSLSYIEDRHLAHQQHLNNYRYDLRSRLRP